MNSHQPVFLSPLCFHDLTNRFCRKPFALITICVALRGVPSVPLCSNSVPSVLRFFPLLSPLVRCFQQLAGSFSLFALFSHTRAFVFSGLQPLLQKHRGMGVSVVEGAAVGAR